MKFYNSIEELQADQNCDLDESFCINFNEYPESPIKIHKTRTISQEKLDDLVFKTQLTNNEILRNEYGITEESNFTIKSRKLYNTLKRKRDE